MAATPSTSLEAESRGILLRTAAIAIESGLSRRSTATEPELGTLPIELRLARASFVTLTVGGRLRGCCGTLEPSRPLAEDVWCNAQASAFRDPRFDPLQRREWEGADLEVAVLSPLDRLAAASESALLGMLRPGEDGLVIAWRGVRATFLPKVWEQLREPREFLGHLKQKAGWSADFWASDVQVWRYSTEVMSACRPAGSPSEPRR
jgi:AmmeMemoRadiSam system protein A